MSKPVSNSITSLKKNFTKKIRAMVKPGIHVFVRKRSDGLGFIAKIWCDGISQDMGVWVESFQREDKQLLFDVLMCITDWRPEWLLKK